MVEEANIVEGDIPDPAAEENSCRRRVPVVRVKVVHQRSRLIAENVTISE